MHRTTKPALALAGAPVNTPPVLATTVTYMVQAHDSLWNIAGARLGNPLRCQERYDLNRGRAEPGGQTLVSSAAIEAGWTLEIPAAIPAAIQPFPAPPAPAARGGGQSG